AERNRPSLIVLRSHIGYPSPNFTDSPKAHGEALGADEVARVKEILGLPQEDFYVPDDVLLMYREAGVRGAAEREKWEGRKQHFVGNDPHGEDYAACLSGMPLHGWEQKLPTFQPGKDIATRAASQEVLSAVVDLVPGLILGAGDLTGNTGMSVKAAGVM